MWYKINRGKWLEIVINQTIYFYQKSKKAIFHKIPLEFKIEKSIDQNKFLTKIKSKSTVDYCGIYQGIFVAFEVKSTIKTTFNLNNIEQHQKDYLSQIVFHQGLAFYILGFLSSNRYFLLWHQNLMIFSSRSITIDDLEKYADEVFLIYPGYLNFLPVVDFVLKKSIF